MDGITALLNQISGIVWGPATLLLLLGTGLFLTVRLKFMTLRRIGKGFRIAFSSRKADDTEGDITPFQALTTAMSATVGTGNIAGVAGAIFLGGPGAVFWMWIMALLGMATKYSEAVLAVKYREVDEDGRHVGGPMYYIKNGLGKRWGWLGVTYALLTMFTALGIGNMIQSNSVADVFEQNLSIPTLWTGIGLAVLTFAVIIGGIRSIAAVAERVVPLMATLYIGGALFILVINIVDVPGALALIVSSAFTGTAAAGGFVGATIIAAMQWGIARGVFSNESGLGSAAIAHAAAKTDDPVRQGTVAMLGTFIDTILICTMTALVIITVTFSTPVDVNLVERVTTTESGETASVWVCPNDEQAARVKDGSLESKVVQVEKAWQTCEPGAAKSALAFGQGFPGGQWIVTFGLIVFAFTTIIAWSYYGERAVEFLFGVKAIMPYRLLWVGIVAIGASVDFRLAWLIADIMNGLMALPNLIALLLLSGTIVALTKAALAKESQ